jgi:hypothetical protein
VIVIAESGITTITLSGAHAVRAIEAATKAKVVTQEVHQ